MGRAAQGAAGGEVVEFGLFFAIGGEAVRDAGFDFEALDDLVLAVGVEVVGAGAVHRGARGKGGALGLDFRGALAAVSGELLRFRGGVEGAAAAGEERGLELRDAGAGGGQSFLGLDVGVDGGGEGLAGAELTMSAEHGDRTEWEAETFHATIFWRWANVCARGV